MTFEEMLAEARTRLKNTRAAAPPIADDPVDSWVVDNLTEDMPCGLEPARARNGLVYVYDMILTPAEARWMAADLLRRADEAEGQ